MSETAFDCFSHPDVGPDRRPELRWRLLAEDAKKQTLDFLFSYGADIRASSSGLFELLAAFTESQVTPREASGFPISLRASAERNASPVWIAALAAAHLGAAGRAGEWRATFPRALPLRWGSRALPPMRNINVFTGKDRARIRMVAVDGSIMCLEIDPSEPEALGVSRIPEVGGLTLLGPETQDLLPVERGTDYTPEPTASVVSSIAGALDLLDRYAPAYASWVNGAVDSVVPIKEPSQTWPNRSVGPALPSIAYLAFPGSAMNTAELLVQEASHQYLHVLRLGTPATNGKDNALYAMPYARWDRTIDAVLSAFHAVANIVLFYRSCLRSRIPDERRRAQSTIAQHLVNLAPMRCALDRSPGLTEAGRDLYQPIRDAVFA